MVLFDIYNHLEKIPFDILSVDSQCGECLSGSKSLEWQREQRKRDLQPFIHLFDNIAYYPEKRA